ncbi:LysR family transcriptional regulator [Nocardia uniformis]|uniref:LysR family transcriptional regulator n=2 Tax=Nocardia uniformis TaxID=53432 RepID=A0A849C8S7_9NOCA|nr:LysR family transcriptional regulator [Nocardia uniformis]
MELRDIEILLTLAEELHFGRTARRLHLSQARISQSVKSQERRIGGRLVDRSNPRSIALTPLGRQLVDDLRPAHGGLLEAMERARRTASGVSGVLRLGFLAGTMVDQNLPSIVAAFRRQRPGWRIDMRQADFSDPTAGLAAGQVDIGVLRVPFPGQEHYRVNVLRSEDRCVALPAAHLLTREKRIAFRQIWQEPFIALPAVSDSWRDHWLAVDARDNTPVQISAVAHTPDEFLAMIANGYGVSLTPAAAQHFYGHPGVRYRPVDGVGPTQVAVVCRTEDPNLAVDDFVSACLEYRTHDDAPISLASTSPSAPGA